MKELRMTMKPQAKLHIFCLSIGKYSIKIFTDSKVSPALPDRLFGMFKELQPHEAGVKTCDLVYLGNT